MTKFKIIKIGEGGGNNAKPQVSGKKVVWNSKDGNKYRILLYDGDKVSEINSSNVTTNSTPLISGDHVVWSARDANNYTQIFLHNGQQTTQLTNHNDISDFFPQISGNNIVWSVQTEDSAEIFFYNGQKTIQLTKDDVYDMFPQISGSNVVWNKHTDNGAEIFLYDGVKTARLTNSKKEDLYPQIFGENVIWQHGIYNDKEKNIFFYNGKNSETIRLADAYNSTSNIHLRASGNNIVWEVVNSERDGGIFLNNGKEIIKLIDNHNLHFSPEISGDYVVWAAGFGDTEEEYYSSSEIFLYDGKEVIQLTDNNVADIEPAIDGNRVVWHQSGDYDSGNYVANIMLATINDTKSSLIQPIDRTSQIINASAVAIFGLIFVYLCKKLIANS
ncbi:MAG: hypothetical protein AAGF83_11610 [Cyanobacteria bacterium P01_G01_bin.67]